MATATYSYAENYTEGTTSAGTPVPVAAFHPELTVPAICLSCVAIVAGLGNLCTIAPFVTSKPLMSNPLNWLVLAMAGYDVTLCSTIAPQLLYLTVGTVRGIGRRGCLVNQALMKVCVAGSISMLASLAVIRMYAVLKRHVSAQVPRTAVVAAIVLSGVVAMVLAAYDIASVLLGDDGPLFFQVCTARLSRDRGPDWLYLGFNALIFAMGLLSLGCYLVQYLCLRYGFPAAPPAGVGATTQHVYTQWEIASARVGAVATVTYFLSYVPMFILMSSGNPNDSSFIPSAYLTMSLAFIQAWSNPLLYMLTTPMYRAAVKAAVRRCRQAEVAPEVIGEECGGARTGRDAAETPYVVRDRRATEVEMASDITLTEVKIATRIEEPEPVKLTLVSLH